MPLDKNIACLEDVPYTISYVIRKRQQIDNLNELESSKRPPEIVIWDGSSDDLEKWLSRVFNKSTPEEVTFDKNEIET